MSRSIQVHDIVIISCEGIKYNYRVSNISDKIQIKQIQGSNEAYVIFDQDKWSIENLNVFHELTFIQYKLMIPKIICIKGKKEELGVSFEKAPTNYMYIGRNCNMGGWKLPKTKWHNPFKTKNENITNVLDNYRNHIIETPELINNLFELSAKTLGCWCAPNPCHGNVLIELYKFYILDIH